MNIDIKHVKCLNVLWIAALAFRCLYKPAGTRPAELRLPILEYSFLPVSAKCRTFALLKISGL
jgi:hypothetical protein